MSEGAKVGLESLVLGEEMELARVEGVVELVVYSHGSVYSSRSRMHTFLPPLRQYSPTSTTELAVVADVPQLSVDLSVDTEHDRDRDRE